jgi:hypothetical protein
VCAIDARLWAQIELALKPTYPALVVWNDGLSRMSSGKDDTAHAML